MSNTYRVQNPVTNEVVENFDQATDAEIEAVLAKSAAAYRAWSERPMSERAEIMTRVSELFVERKDELATIAGEEMGKIHSEAVEEAEFSGAIIKYYAENGEDFTKDQEIPTASNGTAVIRRLPLGPLLGIMPWNFPYYQIARFVAPNLMLGNTIILKDAEICPRSALAVQKIMDDAGVPEGCLLYTSPSPRDRQKSRMPSSA